MNVITRDNLPEDVIRVTHDNLPEAVTRMIHKLDRLEELVINQRNPEPDAWFDILGLCDYLPDKPAKATVYTWVRERKIPYNKKGKKLAFLKSEIDTWIKSGRHKTTAEIQAEAYINNRKP